MAKLVNNMSLRVLHSNLMQTILLGSSVPSKVKLWLIWNGYRNFHSFHTALVEGRELELGSFSFITSEWSCCLKGPPKIANRSAWKQNKLIWLQCKWTAVQGAEQISNPYFLRDSVKSIAHSKDFKLLQPVCSNTYVLGVFFFDSFSLSIWQSAISSWRGNSLFPPPWVQLINKGGKICLLFHIC